MNKYKKKGNVINITKKAKNKELRSELEEANQLTDLQFVSEYTRLFAELRVFLSISETRVKVSSFTFGDEQKFLNFHTSDLFLHKLFADSYDANSIIKIKQNAEAITSQLQNSRLIKYFAIIIILIALSKTADSGNNLNAFDFANSGYLIYTLLSKAFPLLVQRYEYFKLSRDYQHLSGIRELALQLVELTRKGEQLTAHLHGKGRKIALQTDQLKQSCETLRSIIEETCVALECALVDREQGTEAFLLTDAVHTTLTYDLGQRIEHDRDQIEYAADLVRRPEQLVEPTMSKLRISEPENSSIAPVSLLLNIEPELLEEDFSIEDEQIPNIKH